MKNRRKSLCVYALIIATLASGNLLVAGEEKNTYIKRGVTRPLSGTEDLPTGETIARRIGASRSPGTLVGDTYYDYQQNSSMGRQIVFAPEGSALYCGVHLAWMCLPCDGGERHIRYNARDCTGTWAWPIGPGGGTWVSGGGYCSIDATDGGAAVLSYHLYPSMVCVDHNPPFGDFDPVSEAPGPPNCEGWVTGWYEATSRYMWPKIEYDICDSDTVFHVVATEFPEAAAFYQESRTLVYYRATWDAGSGKPVFPSCGMAVDSVYHLSAVVRQDPLSSKVAMVWGHPIHYFNDPNDPCGNDWWQHDVWVWESSDCGLTWEQQNRVNVTDYTLGGTKPVDQCTELFYNDLSAIYDHSGVLHVVWSTPLRNLTTDPCAPLYSARIWHWDDLDDCISIVYDASRPQAFTCDVGGLNTPASKMNISECDGKLYCSFTRFGAHTTPDGTTISDCSEGGYANGDIFLTASTDGGNTWGEAVNLTNTNSDGCMPGDCESEHWSSMAKYSSDSVYIAYIEDKDAGGWPLGEGAITCNPVRMISHECYDPDPFCAAGYFPTEIGYPTSIAPDGQAGCSGTYTTTFTLTVTNTGNQTADYSLATSESWLTPSSTSGYVGAGCGGNADVEFTIGPIASEGVFDAEIYVEACGGMLSGTIPVRVFVFCNFYLPEYDILSTACWSVGVWNIARAGIAKRGYDGNMYWFEEGFSVMYDESLVITYADDTCQTWFSVFDGSSDNVRLSAMSDLTTASYADYEYAHGMWANGDTAISGEIEHYLPTDPDTCVIIERATLCNSQDTAVTIHIGEAIDWDIPDGEGGVNSQCGIDSTRNMVYQHGPAGVVEEVYYTGASFCHDIPGAIVLRNGEWIDPNLGYYPCEIGGLIARHTGFEADCDGLQDYNSVYVIGQSLRIEPDSCLAYCMVKASSLDGLEGLQALIDKGKQWAEDHGIDYSCVFECGDADASDGVDIDDVVYLIAFIFSGGPPPGPYESGDADCGDSVDIDDVVWLIAYIFSGGYAPCDTDGDEAPDC